MKKKRRLGKGQSHARIKVVCNRLRRLTKIADRSFLEMGALLSEVLRERLAQEIGYKTFEDFVEREMNFGYRKAKFLIDVHEVFVRRLNAPVVVLLDIGWTKLTKLLSVVCGKNLRYWLDFARQNKTLAVDAAVRKVTKKSVYGYTLLTIGLFEDEKGTVNRAIATTMRAFSYKRRGQALARVCSDYLFWAEREMQRPVVNG